MFSCIFDSFDHALDSSVTKTARYDYAVAAVEHFSYSVLIEIFRLYPLDINFCAVLKTAVTESFCYGKISVLKLNILANKTDSYFLVTAMNSAYHFLPLFKVWLSALKLKMMTNNICKALFFKPERHFIK